MRKEIEKVKKGIVIGCIISAAILVGILGSYAYFISTGNNNKNQSANIQTGNMALTFSDGNNGINETLNFGESITKTFTIENTGSLEAKAKINWLNLMNTYLKESLTYTLSYSDSESGEYTGVVTNKNVPRSETSITKTLANNLTIPVGTTYYYKLEITLNYLEDIEQTSDLNAILTTEFQLEEGYEQGMIPLMVESIINEEELPENSVKEGSPTFVNTATTDETKNGLYSLEDDYGTSYYFRGAVKNNYVKFGGFYWRIIRINGDGSLRIIYDGTSAHSNGEKNLDRLPIKAQYWHSYNNDAKYVGWMFAPTGVAASTSKEEAQTNIQNIDAKNSVDDWYKTNIFDKGLGNFVSDTLFCNDRSIPDTSITGWGIEGYGRNDTAYGARGRFLSNRTEKPIFTCPQQNDAFTTNDRIKGNGSLTYPVGLITADEVIAAGSGAVGNVNKSYYLYTGYDYWLLSANGILSTVGMFTIHENGGLSNPYINQNYYLKPVINLNTDYVIRMIGNGTIGNEYRVE